MNDGGPFRDQHPALVAAFWASMTIAGVFVAGGLSFATCYGAAPSARREEPAPEEPEAERTDDRRFLVGPGCVEYAWKTSVVYLYPTEFAMRAKAADLAVQVPCRSEAEYVDGAVWWGPAKVRVVSGRATGEEGWTEKEYLISAARLAEKRRAFAERLRNTE